MSNSIKVSLLIPCYNVSEFLDDAMQCIINQTYSNLEIVLVNDGSTDNTLEKLTKFANEDSRIVLVNNEKNIGLIKSLNKGIQYCSGTYIERFDADDLIGLDRIEKQIEIIQKNSTIDLITSYATYITPNGKFHSKVESFYCNSLHSAAFLNLFECPLLHAGMLVRTSLLKEYMYNDNAVNSHIEDYDLFSRLIINQVNLFVDTRENQRYFYRRNPNSVSSRNLGFQKENAIRKSKENLQNILNYSIDDEILKAMILKTETNWTPNIVSKTESELKKIKLKYFDLNSDNITEKDKKIITEWTQLRLLKIISTVIFKGNFTSKIKAIQILFKNSNMFLSKKIMQNILTRFVWIFNKIRYNN
ncbi:MAG: glycosyltransferase family 2 protein [Bacteroidia bacterium]